MQRQFTLFTGLQEPENVWSTTVSGRPPFAWLTANNRANCDCFHALHLLRRIRNRASIQEKKRLHMDRMISTLIVVSCEM